MGSPEKQLDQPAIAPLPLVVVDVAAALFPPASLESAFAFADHPSSSSQRNLAASPSPCRDFPILGFPESHPLPPSPSASDVNLETFSSLGSAAIHAATTSLFPCDYTSRVGNHTVHAMMHVPAFSAPQQSLVMEGTVSLSESGNTAMHAAPTSPVHEFSPPRYYAALAATRSGAPPRQGLDGVQNLPSVLVSPGLSRRVFMQSYVSTLLPELKRIYSQSSSIPLNEKLSAVKLAADMSLAISAGGKNTWSQALIQELASTSATNLPLAPLEVRKKNRNLRKSSFFRGSFYASKGSILRRRPRRGGSHAVDLKGCSGGGLNSTSLLACLGLSKASSHGSFGSPASILARGCSHASVGGRASCASFPSMGFFESGVGDAHQPSQQRFGSCAVGLSQLPMGRFTVKRVKRHHSGLASYVKILRNSRSKRNCGAVKRSADAHNEAGRASLPTISKEHIESLGGLVPGGRRMDVPLLLQEAADYILSLQIQVEALQSLSQFVSL